MSSRRSQVRRHGDTNLYFLGPEVLKNMEDQLGKVQVEREKSPRKKRSEGLENKLSELKEMSLKLRYYLDEIELYGPRK